MQEEQGWELLMKPYAETFYKSKQWKDCRESYFRMMKGLCENCLQEGRYTPAKVVHHIEHINPFNICNPEITLNYNNLQCLCSDCHSKMHHPNANRYKVDEDGKVSPH